MVLTQCQYTAPPVAHIYYPNQPQPRTSPLPLLISPLSASADCLADGSCIMSPKRSGEPPPHLSPVISASRPRISKPGGGGEKKERHARLYEQCICVCARSPRGTHTTERSVEANSHLWVCLVCFGSGGGGYEDTRGCGDTGFLLIHD